MKSNPARLAPPAVELISDRFNAVRRQSMLLAEPLSAEDQCVQSMPDTSPTKWHLAHVTWFFETFLLKPHLDDYIEFHSEPVAKLHHYTDVSSLTF